MKKSSEPASVSDMKGFDAEQQVTALADSWLDRGVAIPCSYEEWQGQGQFMIDELFLTRFERMLERAYKSYRSRYGYEIAQIQNVICVNGA